MDSAKKDIFTVLKRTETPARARARKKENPVYTDCYGHRVDTLLHKPVSKEDKHAE